MKIKNKTLKKLSQQINKTGITYNPLFNKDYGNTPNIAVSPFPERSKRFKGRATRKMIINYCNTNNDLFQKGFSLGAWLDKSSARTYLDITATIPLEKRLEAITLGKSANQIAVFNLSNFTEISLGGTGESSSSITPFEERLEKALILMQH